MSDLNTASAAPSIQAAKKHRTTTFPALLSKVTADHDAIEQWIANLSDGPACSAHLLSDLGPVLADHYHYVAERRPPQWTLDAKRAVTIEEDCAEVASIFQHAQALEPRSTSLTQAVDELVAAIHWHIDVEEATIYAEEATLYADEAAPYALEANPARLAS